MRYFLLYCFSQLHISFHTGRRTIRLDIHLLELELESKPLRQDSIYQFVLLMLSARLHYVRSYRFSYLSGIATLCFFFLFFIIFYTFYLSQFSLFQLFILLSTVNNKYIICLSVFLSHTDVYLYFTLSYSYHTSYSSGYFIHIYIF